MTNLHPTTIERFQKVKEAIYKAPAKNFGMSNWGKFQEDIMNEECGTACCVAGWAGHVALMEGYYSPEKLLNRTKDFISDTFEEDIIRWFLEFEPDDENFHLKHQALTNLFFGRGTIYYQAAIKQLLWDTSVSSLYAYRWREKNCRVELETVSKGDMLAILDAIINGDIKLDFELPETKELEFNEY